MNRAHPRISNRRRRGAARRAAAFGAGALALLFAPAPGADPGLGAGRFLVASRAMADPRFAHTVVLLVEHSPGGTLGLVVNRPTGVRLGVALPERAAGARADEALWYGGPVEPGRAAVLAAGQGVPQPSRAVLADLHFSTDPAVLDALLAATGRRVRVYGGYAGWGPGQLAGELARGDWTVVEASVERVFHDDGIGLWRELAGARGTWVRRAPPPRARSLVLAHHLQRGEGAVVVDVHAHEHGAAAYAAVLHVPRVTRGTVDRELDARPAERTGG